MFSPAGRATYTYSYSNIFMLFAHVVFSFSGLSTVEAYNYKTNEWMYVAAMNTRRSSVGVGVVDGKTELCV